MRELTKKILESGLVDKHLALAMERWGNLDRGDAEVVGTAPVTKETFEKFADDIAMLIDPDEPLRETLLDLEIDGTAIKCRTFGTKTSVPAILDKMGNLIVLQPVQDGVVLVDDVNNVGYEVDMIEPIYVNEEIKAYRLTVDICASAIR